MIIYSVTVSILKHKENEWFDWMQSKHIPDVMATGYFLEHNLLRLMEPVIDENFATYSIQYTTANLRNLQEYQDKAAPALQAEHTELFKDQFTAFRTLLEKL